jgi:uncharacterized protein
MLVTVLLLCAALPAQGQRVESLPKPVGYVSDFAHVMSPGAIAKLNQLCSQVESETHDRIDVVTIETTGGEPMQQYVADLRRSWKSGKREAMVVVAVKDRQRLIAAGPGLEAFLPRAELNKISGQMVPMLRNNDFDGAMNLAVAELAARMGNSAGVKMGLRLPWGAPAAAPAKYGWLRPVTWGLVLLLFVSLGVWAYASEAGDAIRRKLGKRGRGKRS